MGMSLQKKATANNYLRKTQKHFKHKLALTANIRMQYDILKRPNQNKAVCNALFQWGINIINKDNWLLGILFLNNIKYATKKEGPILVPQYEILHWKQVQLFQQIIQQI